MWMKEKGTEDLILINDTQQLTSPLEQQVMGRRQAGEEEQPAQSFDKSELLFPSGESVPRCWTDPEYNMPSP